MREFILKLFGIHDYEKDFNELSQNHNELCRVYEALKKTSDARKCTIEELEETIELVKKDPNSYWSREIEGTLANLEKCYEEERKAAETTISYLEERIASLNEQNDKLKREVEVAEHRGIATGRMDAYSQMGIWNIDAHKRGDVLVMNREGEVFELMQGLEDVEADEDDFVEAVTKDLDEIEIDDLVKEGDAE